MSGFGNDGVLQEFYGNGESVPYLIKDVTEKINEDTQRTEYFNIICEAINAKHKGKTAYLKIFVKPDESRFNDVRVKRSFIKAMFTNEEIKANDLSPAKVRGKFILIKWGNVTQGKSGGEFQSPAQITSYDPDAQPAQPKPMPVDADFSDFDKEFA